MGRGAVILREVPGVLAAVLAVIRQYLCLVVQEQGVRVMLVDRTIALAQVTVLVVVVALVALVEMAQHRIAVTVEQELHRQYLDHL